MRQSRLALKRRVFLSAMGLGISAPLAMKMSRMAVAQPGPRPRRLLIVFIPHGVPAEHYQPVWDGTTLNLMPAAQGTFQPVGVLAPLQPWANKVSIIQGVNMNDGATNHAAVRAVLTGFAEGKSSDSIDTLIGAKMGKPPLVLGALAYDALFGFNENCYVSKQGAWVVPQISPVKAADNLFGAMGGGMPGIDESVFRNRVSDLLDRQIDRLHRSLTGLTREQNKLLVHLDAVRTLKAGRGLRPMTCTGRPALPAVEAARGKNTQDPLNFTSMLDANLELIAAAFSCGAANLITLQCMYVNAQYKMDFPGGPGVDALYHDPTSHSQDAAGRRRFAQVQRWFYDRLATKLISVLASTPDTADSTDPNRTVLDNTLIITCSEIADGFFHNSQEVNQSVPLDNGMQKMMRLSLPYVVIGGGSGWHKQGGQIIGGARNHTDVLASLADAMGTPITTMGSQNVSVISDLRQA